MDGRIANNTIQLLNRLRVGDLAPDELQGLHECMQSLQEIVQLDVSKQQEGKKDD